MAQRSLRWQAADRLTDPHTEDSRHGPDVFNTAFALPSDAFAGFHQHSFAQGHPSDHAASFASHLPHGAQESARRPVHPPMQPFFAQIGGSPLPMMRPGVDDNYAARPTLPRDRHEPAALEHKIDLLFILKAIQNIVKVLPRLQLGDVARRAETVQRWI